MAGRGPTPKLNNQRGRPSGLGEWKRLPPLDGPVLPELDDVLDKPRGGWPKVALLYWGAWRRSPVSATWAPEDVALAVDTLSLIVTDPLGKANEIRLRLDNLGLTPKGRRDGRILLTTEPEAVAPHKSSARVLRILPEAR